ncbi:MAG: ribbon-helix-helix domain-containing protein [Bacillota bacterium]|nr:ribbon-helix-helix domain-containing protein [Bacillota bacterium]
MPKIRFTTYVEESTRKQLKKLSEESRVPEARYIQEALEDLLKKYVKATK